jgi:hypothetical protein
MPYIFSSKIINFQDYLTYFCADSTQKYINGHRKRYKTDEV